MLFDRDNDHALPNGDGQGTFQAQARRTRKRHEAVGCFGLLAVFSLFATLLLLSHPDRFAWYWAFVAGAAGTALLVWVRPAPWPDCPACSGSFRRLGVYCPHCGDRLSTDATPTRADCAGCGYRMSIVSKAPQYKQEYRMSSDYRFRLVPIRYCTHCGTQLN
jgi:hypothetical protein